MAGSIICEVGIRTITDPTWSNLIIESNHGVTDAHTDVSNFEIIGKIFPNFQSIVASVDKYHIRLSWHGEIYWIWDIMATCGATNDHKVGIMTTLSL